MRIVLFLLLLLTATNAKAKQSEEIYVEPKVNLAIAAIAVFNPSLEIGFGNSSAFQLDYMGAYAKYDYMGSGEPFMFTMAMAQYRRYLPNRDHQGLFLAGDFGLLQYHMSKNIVPFIPHDHEKGVYDVGFGWVAGLSGGYKWFFKSGFGLEVFLSYGFQHSWHEQFSPDGIRTAELNRTAEWLFYKGGLNLTYRFGGK